MTTMNGKGPPVAHALQNWVVDELQAQVFLTGRAVPEQLRRGIGAKHRLAQQLCPKQDAAVVTHICDGGRPLSEDAPTRTTKQFHTFVAGEEIR